MNNLLRIISVAGPQAAEFLQGQISADVNSVNTEKACLGTLCNLKGRMTASFVLVNPEATVFYMLLQASIAELAQKELAKYAIFSDCEISLVDSPITAMKTDSKEVFSVTSETGAVSVTLPGSVQVVIGESELEGMSADEFIAASIDASLPWLTEVTVDQFLPQAFFSDDNAPEMQAISYTKGCYKGQEVVARMHFKGEMKEGLYRLELDYFPAGHEFRNEQGKLVGQVVQSTEKHNALLAVMRHDAVAEFL